jgi:hypothetical protein
MSVAPRYRGGCTTWSHQSCDGGIDYSAEGTTCITLDGVPEFARAPGSIGYTANTIVGFGGIQAKYVKLTIEANCSGLTPVTGLSEVRCFYIPDRSATNL